MKIRKQQGWTIWSLTFNLLIIGVIAWVGLKIVPLYMDNSTIRATIKPLAHDRSLSGTSHEEIVSLIKKRLSVNSVRWVKTDDIEFVEEDNFTQVRIDYEKRIKMVSNIDLVVTFKNHVNLPSN